MRGIAQPTQQSHSDQPTPIAPAPAPAPELPNQPAQKGSRKRASFLSFKTSNGFFYSVIAIFAVPIATIPIFYVWAGEQMGKQAGPFFLWVVILSYAVLKRLGRSRSTSLVSAIGIALGAQLLTGVANGIVNSDRYAIEKEWDKNPAFVAMKENDPKAYGALLSDVTTIFRTDPKSPERQKKVSLKGSSAMKGYFQRTSDSALISIYKAEHRHLNLLIHQDPSSCYEYSWGVFSTAALKLPEAIRNEYKDLLAAAINASSPSAVAVNVQRAEQSLEKVYAFAEKRLGGEAVLMENLEKRSGDAIGTCKAMVAFSGALIELLPAPDAANLIRYIMREG